MSLPTHFTLNTGAKIPAVGLGTWKSEPGEVRKAVAYALKDGYRHIDAALIYGNEVEVGKGIVDSGVPRKDIFLTSKLWNTDHSNVAAGLEKSLKNLGVDYLDLYLVHWPVRLLPEANKSGGKPAVDHSWDLSKTWSQMEEVYKTGKVKAIGVANWSIPYLENLRKTWTVVPAVNQVELHPYLPQNELRTYCQKLGILLEAYSPLGSSGAPISSDETIRKLADKYGVSPATILISFHVNRGDVVLPKSVTEARISSNRKIVALDKKDLDLLNSLGADGKTKRINALDWGSDLGFADWFGPAKK